MARCGACNLCCRLLAVPDIGKPARMLCWHTTIHGGCAVQGEKATDPKLAACAQWECMWLESQSHEDTGEHLPRSLRPDSCHVVLGPRDRQEKMLLHVHVDPEHPTAWKEPGISDYLANLIAHGVSLAFTVGEQQFRIDSTKPALTPQLEISPTPLF